MIFTRNIFYFAVYIILITTIIFFISCLNRNSTQNVSASEKEESHKENVQQDFESHAQFELDLAVILEGDDPYLWILVDKQNALSQDYEPDDLVQLTGINASYKVGRNDMYLRVSAERALEEMAAAARKEGLVLLASSAYRSFDYQQIVYSTWVRDYGQEEADRFSARPGHSQHQLGTVVDFGSITDAFAETPEGKWLYANASRFGWSLSYPQGYEHITGYKWESWHYRYVGKELAYFIDTYFEGIQQLALEYLSRF